MSTSWNKALRVRPRRGCRLTLRRAWLPAGAAMMALSGLAAAPATASPAGRAGRTISTSTLARLRAAIRQAEAIPRFTAPTAPVNASKARGKSFVTIPLNSEIPVCAGITSVMEQLGKKLGVKVVNFANNGSPVVWAQGVEEAVHNHLNGIALVCSLDPAAVTAQLKAAHAAHIPVMAGQLVNVGQPIPPLTTAAVGQVFDQAARVLVDDAIVNHGGHPFNALYVSSPDAYSNAEMYASARSELSRQCGPACKLTTVSVPISQWATAMQSTVASALLANRNITTVFMPYDGAVPLALPAFTSSKRPGLKVYTYGTSANVVKLILTTHGLIAADYGIAAIWPAYTDMDQMLRLMTGQRPMPPSVDVTPGRLFVASNAKQFAARNAGAGTAFIKGYEKAWGLKG